MLIRWATAEDKPAWIELAKDVSDIFGHTNMSTDSDFLEYVDNKLSKNEALIAVDRMSNNCLGIIGFSRRNNRITWFGVFEKYRNRGAGMRLLTTALRQLDNSKDITVETFCDGHEAGLPARALYHKVGFVDSDNTLYDNFGNSRCKMILPATDKKRGGSFHYRYTDYVKYSKVENCPCCNNAEMPDGNIDIAELKYSFATAERKAQGRLFGKCHVLIKNHYVNFEEIPFEEMAGFMSEIQLVGKALRKVTGAVKINYEIHANSGPHIHCHLFPRYLDDDFPSGPIDYRITEPSPYESDEEFCWFVEVMRSELKKFSNKLQ